MCRGMLMCTAYGCTCPVGLTGKWCNQGIISMNKKATVNQSFTNNNNRYLFFIFFQTVSQENMALIVNKLVHRIVIIICVTNIQVPALVDVFQDTLCPIVLKVRTNAQLC